jgi:hypothetical protein
VPDLDQISAYYHNVKVLTITWNTPSLSHPPFWHFFCLSSSEFDLRFILAIFSFFFKNKKKKLSSDYIWWQCVSDHLLWLFSSCPPHWNSSVLVESHHYASNTWAL